MYEHFWGVVGILFLLGITYMVGAFSSGYLYALWKEGLDIRQHGSGGSGATNTARVLNDKKLFFIMLSADVAKAYALFGCTYFMGKGYFPITELMYIILCQSFILLYANVWPLFALSLYSLTRIPFYIVFFFLFKFYGASQIQSSPVSTLIFSHPVLFTVLLVLVVVVCLSVHVEAQGKGAGKGVSIWIAFILFFFPLLTLLIGALVWGLVFLLTKTVGLASLALVWSTVFFIIFYKPDSLLFYTPLISVPSLVFIMAIIITVRHKDNIISFIS